MKIRNIYEIYISTPQKGEQTYGKVQSTGNLGGRKSLGLGDDSVTSRNSSFHDHPNRFIQRKTITKGIKLSVSKEPDADGEVSQFGALATALASTIGTGNIIGVGTAVALGGPGAVLWCWLTGVFGIATKYSESLIAVNIVSKPKMDECRVVPCTHWNAVCICGGWG